VKLFVTALVAGLAGCSSGVVAIGLDAEEGGLREASAPDAGTPDVERMDALSDATSQPDAGGPPPSEAGVPDGSFSPCPATAPKAESRCPTVGQECEYGTDPSAACNMLATCTSGAASGSLPGWTYPIATTPCKSGTCPSAYPSALAGETCTPSGLVCSYTQGTCTCAPRSGPVSVDSGPAVQWQCFPAETGCPSPRPAVGSACTASSLTKACNYGACAGGVELSCVDGEWQEVMVGCPASS